MTMLGIRRAAAVSAAMVLASVAFVVGATAAQSGPDRVRVIVELSGPPALAEAPGGSGAGSWERARVRADALAADHREFVQEAGGEGIDVTPVEDLTAAYNGLVAEIPKDRLASLASLPGVRAVHRDTRVMATLRTSVPLVGAPEVWQRRDPSGLPARGSGVVVALLDTGVDYSHPDLGGGFGPGRRVVAGHDFVNDDGDPMDDNGHGTHVAGIVGASGAVTGVAPDVSLTAYKVLGPGGSGDVSDVLAGLDAAVAPDNPYRADVVNLSLSGPGDGTDVLSKAAEAAVDAGVVVVTAAGNAGPGTGTVTSPGSAPRVLAVGASTSGVTVPAARLVAPERDLHAARREFSANVPAAGLTLDVVDLGQGTPGTYKPGDVAGKAVLMQTEGTVDLDKALAAEAAGAQAAFFYVTDTWGPVEQAARPFDPAAAQVPAAQQDHAFAAGIVDGRLERLVAMQIRGASAVAIQDRIAQGAARVSIVPVDATDQVASFSSRGPSGLFGSKPDLVAPGVEIWSTWPGGEHQRLSGSSMAAPHAAGAAALLRQLYPAWSAETTMAALAGSARRLPDAAALTGGAGRLDAAAAARAALVAPARTLSYGLADTSGETIDRRLPLALENVSGSRQRARLTVRPADGSRASVRVEPDVVNVPAGGRVTVTARLRQKTPAEDADETGFVTVDVDGASDVRVPYSLAIRHLGVHVTPDPAPAGAVTTVFVNSPALLPAPPAVRLHCPGTPPVELATEPSGARLWRARAEVGRPGVCQVTARAKGDDRYGAPALTGATAFEAAGEPRPGPRSSWQPIGPNGEGGLFAFDAADRDRMAVLSRFRPSLFVSGDGGRNWSELRTMPVAGGVPIDVAVDPRDHDRIYVAVNSSGVDASYRGRLLLTEDGGRNWRILSAPDAAIDTIDLAPDGSALALGGDAGLYVSTDDFEHATPLPLPGNQLFDLHWIGADLYAGTDAGLLRFRAAAGDAPGEPETLFRPPVLPWVSGVAGDGKMLLVDSYFDGLYVSRDGGQTFVKLFDPTGFPRRFLDLELIGDDIYGVTSNDAWIGRDRGARWERWDDPLALAVEIDILPRPGGGLLVSAARGGVFAADEPGAYRRVGLPAADVLAVELARDPGGADALLAGGPRDVYRRLLPGDGGLEWGLSGGEGIRDGGTTRFLAASPDNPQVVWKVRDDNNLTFGIHRSDDGGRTFRRVASPSEFASALLVHPGDPDQVYVSYTSVTGAGLVVTRDGGRTWRKLDQERRFDALAGDPRDPDVVWAGDRDGLWRSDDGGVHFRLALDEPITAIAVNGRDSEHVVAGGRALFVTRNGGRRFEQARAGELDMWVSDLEFARDRGHAVFAGTMAFYDELGVLVGGRGVLRSDDRGRTWRSYSRGLANPDVTSLELDPRGERLYAGTLGGSVHTVEVER